MPSGDTPKTTRDGPTNGSARLYGEQHWDLFVSANGRDFGVANEVRAEIERWGLRVFFCEATAADLGTTNFTKTIYAALDSADNFLFVASEPPVPGAAAISGWCRAEVETFVNERNSGRKRGNLCSVLLGSMSVERLPLELRTALAFPRSRLAELRPFLRAIDTLAPAKVQQVSPDARPPSLAHPLHAYPLGPMVPFEEVPPGLVGHCANIYGDPDQADLARRRANFERIEADPGGDSQRMCVLTAEVANPARVPPLTYWNQVINIACLKSPRMMGAILEELDFDLIPGPLKAQVERFCHRLRRSQ